MKTWRFIGMALLAVVVCVNFAACSDDDEQYICDYIQNVFQVFSTTTKIVY